MSKARAKSAASGGIAAANSGKSEKSPASLATPRPLRSRKPLFIVLTVVLAIWMMVLLVMYYKTVHQPRERQSPPREAGMISGTLDVAC